MPESDAARDALRRLVGCDTRENVIRSDEDIPNSNTDLPRTVPGHMDKLE